MAVTALRPDVDREKVRDLEFGGAAWPYFYARVDAVNDAQRAMWAQEKGAAEGCCSALAALAAACELLVDDPGALRAQGPRSAS